MFVLINNDTFIKGLKMMLIIFLLINGILIHPVHVTATAGNAEIAIVILSQDNPYHEKLFQTKEEDIQKQSEYFPQWEIRVFNSYHLIDNEVGHWTILPLLELAIFKEFKWVLFIEDITSINLGNALNVFEKYNSSKELFVGHALLDVQATIIHHFAGPGSLLYPHFAAGFFMSHRLIQRLFSMLPLGDEYSFSIDAKYELSKFIWESGKGVQLQHESLFCILKNSENCATWIEESFPDCGSPVRSDKLHIGVKTCHKFHLDRLTVVKNTWASETINVKIFSDESDEAVPTIRIPVQNVDYGHCEKTLSIMKHYINKNVSLDWLAIVDDDTLISVKRLQKLLACYNSSDTVALGERYGYGATNSLGYDYITGGGGMVFSFPTLKFLVRHCHCPSIDSPDDMIIGMCLKRMDISVTHSPYFHQARPTDYSPKFLKPFKHVSFHKHWMINPYSVYQEWLQEPSAPDLHTEL